MFSQKRWISIAQAAYATARGWCPAGRPHRLSARPSEHLEPVAHTLVTEPLLNGAVQLYERLVERAIDGRDRYYYASAGGFCKVIRAIRRVQGREADFQHYYQGLFTTYSRFSALKDELRKAIEGPTYRRKG